MTSRPEEVATVFAIGAPWPWEDHYIAERGFYWHPHQGMLLLVEPNVTREMCDDLAGPVDVALLGYGPLVGLLVRFSGGWGWNEAMVARPSGAGIPDSLIHDGDDGKAHAWFTAVLVDQKTKRIEWMKGFTVSPHFTKALQRETADRWGKPVTQTEIDRAQDEWAARYPSINSALKASMARSHGGD